MLAIKISLTLTTLLMLTLTVLLKNLTATATTTITLLLTDAEHKNLTEKYPNHVTDTDVVTTSLTDVIITILLTMT